jgi:NAD(P)-dependent dehydrogenase (short-subunit alcohol dehydrogenase family)
MPQEKKSRPHQHQRKQPGRQDKMRPRPRAEKKIRVNAVAPGPIWTPLIPSTFPANEVATFGSDTPLGRAGEPEEVATCFVFLASDDSSYITGQVLHPNGGRVVNG